MTDTTKNRTVSALHKYTGQWMTLVHSIEMSDEDALSILEIIALSYRDGKDAYFTLNGKIFSAQGFVGFHIDPTPELLEEKD